MMIAHNISLRYSKNENFILNNISAIFPSGRITFLLGKSGSGKTKLLQCLAGLEKPLDGIIMVDGNELGSMSPSQRARHVGIVFQQFHLFPHLTVLQNCIQPMVVNSFEKNDCSQKALINLKSVTMDTFAHRYPNQLSLGQQQRVAIARAMCLNPPVLLLDEPTSSLDPISTKSLLLLLQQFAGEGLCIVISSHDIKFIRSILDRAYLIDYGEVIDYFDKRIHTFEYPSQINAYLSSDQYL